MLVRNASLRRPMCFRCLMFSLSGPFELLFFNSRRYVCCSECYVASNKCDEPTPDSWNISVCTVVNYFVK